MPTQNTDETKKRILNLIQQKGPSLPVQISREIKMSTLFISAFLSELKDEKRIKISNLKVGGSPLYYLEGQETQLENFKQYLHQKEVEAFELLKKNKILKDSEQEPAIRVALRSIKDFSFSFKKDEDLFWRFLTVSEDEIKNIFEPSREEIKMEIKEEKAPAIEIKIEPIAQNTEKASVESGLSEPNIQRPKKIKQEHAVQHFENPLATVSEKKPEKKPKSVFVLNIIEFLEKNKFKILEEKEYKAKEYNCIVQFQTSLGPIDFLTQAKDKKSVSDQDLDQLLRQAQSIPLPALFLYGENLTKKALQYAEKYHSIIKVKKIS